MTNGTDRLDRIERILEEAAKRQDQDSERAAKNSDLFSERMDSISERMGSISERMDGFFKGMAEVRGTLQEMAARQQYHDEAFERFDADMKLIKEAQAVDGEHIRALARIAELHNQRFEHLEGGDVN